MSEYREAYKAPPRIERPIPVTLIALLQVVKGAFFIFVAGLMLIAPNAIRDSGWDASKIVAVAASDGSAMMPVAAEVLYGRNPTDTNTFALAGVMAFLGVWLFYIAWGMWRLKEWARKTRIGISGLQAWVALTMLSVYIPGFQDEASSLTGAQWRDFFIRMTINLLIIFYLILDVRVRGAFKQNLWK